MMTQVFALFDHKAANFGVPFFMQNRGMALRAFMDLVNDEKTMVNKHPEDFSFFLIGEYDDGTGEIKSCKPVPLGNASSFKQEQGVNFTKEDASKLLELLRGNFNKSINGVEVIQ